MPYTKKEIDRMMREPGEVRKTGVKRHLVMVQRRYEYLLKLPRKGGYDRGEIAALEWAIPILKKARLEAFHKWNQPEYYI